MKSKRGETGIYVPRGRREMNEKKKIDEPEVEEITAIVTGEKFVTKKSDEEKVVDNDQEQPKKLQTAIYVPRGRRELNEKKKLEDDEEGNSRPSNPPKTTLMKEKEELMERRRLAFFSDEDGSSPPPTRSTFPPTQREDSSYFRNSRTNMNDLTESTEKLVIDDDEFRDYISDEKLATYCLVIESLPFDITDAQKQQIIRPYEETGGVSSWITPRDCLFVYLNEPQCRRGLSARCFSHRAKPLDSSDYHNTPTVLAVARKLHGTLKPERDSRVANRLIGAALGLRIRPPSSTSTSSSSATTAGRTARSSGTKAVVEDEPLNDAWD